MNSVVRAKTVLSIFSIALLITLRAPANEIDPQIEPVHHCCADTCDCGEGCCDSSCRNTRSNCCGACCRKVCVATVEKEKVEKHCWNTEAKDICIPKVVLPWQAGGSRLTLFSCLQNCSGCGGCADTCCGDDCCSNKCCGNGCCVKPRCGRVITVCDLKKEKYECEECVCKWDIRRLPPCCKNGGSRGCSGRGCCGDVCEPGCSASVARLPGIQLVAATSDSAVPSAGESSDASQTGSSAEKPSWLKTWTSRK